MIRSLPIDNKTEATLLSVLVAFIVLFPLCNGVFAEGSALHVSAFSMGVWGKYLCYAVLAVSLNMLWGYTGLLCLGQNLFFGLGGYAFGMYLMMNLGGPEATETVLPNFMEQRGMTMIPDWFLAFQNPVLALLAALIIPGLVALVFGTLAFRSRIKGVYFSILTQALVYAAMLLFRRGETGFGGTNGFTNYQYIFGASINSESTARWLFIGSGVLLLLVYLLVAWMLKTKFGLVQQAIRDSENRVRFSGYSTTHFKAFVFTLSAMIAGAAGALFVPQAGIINPSEMLPAKGLDVVVWVAVGGRGTKMGPIIGAILVNLLKSYTTREFPEFWLLILGGLFVLVVLFMPDGIMGLWDRYKGLLFSRKSAEPVAA